MGKIRGALLDVVAALACIVAGVILVLFQSADSSGYSFTGHNFFEAIAHGAGLYFVGKGLFVARSTHLAAETTVAVRRLAELAALRHDRETRPARSSD